MKKCLILALVAVFATCAARAEVVSQEMAKTAANAWAERNARFGAGGVATNAVAVCDTNAAHSVLWYQVSMSGGCCLIVAPVTEIEPVVAALEDDPGELPAAHPLRALLVADMRSRLRFLNLYVEDSSGGATLLSASPAPAEDENVSAVRAEWAEQQKSKWRNLVVGRRGGMTLMAAESVGVLDPIDEEIRVVPGFEKNGPLTHWNQSNAGGGPCFNYYTPNNAVCGCVATACSALIQFFGTAEGPEAGYQHTCSYNGSSSLYTVKGGAYDWSILPKNWGGAADSSNALTEEQRELLGRVAYDAGVCLGMMWTDDESGAYTRDIAAVLRDNFGFQYTVLVDNPKLDQYHKLIYMQCWAGAPVGMGIQGHAVVACGYGKDSDGVPRARVFMGWGGSGDAWYALPQIDTQSTINGGTYLSEVISCVITMIGYQDDKVVPVCGRLIPTLNATVGCCGISTNANENGYFGLRISAAEAAGVKPVVANVGGTEKPASVVLGPAATVKSETTYSFNAAELCAWIPDDILITLLNSETASTFAEAKERALASIDAGNPKPILAFSGSWGEEATDAAWAILQSYDDDNVDDFTNKYVVLCTPYSLSSTSPSDGNPSIAVFDPRSLSVEPNKIWSFYNGRLDYWTIGGAVYTNDAALAEAAATNVVVNGSVTTYITGEEITNAVLAVIGAGRGKFLTGVSGITLDVVGEGGEPGAVEPAYGFHENEIANGTTVVATAPYAATNDDENVEFKCTGWLLTSTNSEEVLTGTGTTAQFAPVPNGAYTLTWFWETNAVKITVEVLASERQGTISPGTGWFKFGSTVAFTAVPSDEPKLGIYYYFYDWVFGELGQLTDDDDYEVSSNRLTFEVARPVTVKAEFRSGGKVPQELPYQPVQPDPPDPVDPPNPPDPSDPSVTNVFDIVWNDGLDNLSSGYSTNLLTAADLQANGWTVNDLTVSAPTGWVVSVTQTRSGDVVATLARDDDALTAAMESCELTVYPNDDDTLTVEATIANGLRGFWYVIYGSDDLSTWSAVASGTYESGTPAAQAKGSAANPVDEVSLSITVTPGDSAAGSKRFYKVVSGSTSDPLAEEP